MRLDLIAFGWWGLVGKLPNEKDRRQQMGELTAMAQRIEAEEELERHAALYDSADLHHTPGICFTCRAIAEMRGDT